MPMAPDSRGTNTLMRSRVYQYSYVQDNSNIGPEEGDLFRILVSFQSSIIRSGMCIVVVTWCIRQRGCLTLVQDAGSSVTIPY